MKQFKNSCIKAINLSFTVLEEKGIIKLSLFEQLYYCSCFSRHKHCIQQQIIQFFTSFIANMRHVFINRKYQFIKLNH